MLKVRKLLIVILMQILLTTVGADSFHIIVNIWQGEFGIAVDCIDSITFCKPKSMFVHLKDSSTIDFNTVDSITIRETVSDTLYIMYRGKHAFVCNSRADAAFISQNDSNADVSIKIKEKYSTPIITVSGSTADGRLCIDSEVDYTLVLNGVNITSSHAPAINSISNHKATLMLKEGTDNSLSDANLYVLSDSSETSSGCVNTNGALSIAGKGSLTVYGNMKHALYAKKSISIKEGTLAIPYAVSDAIHSGKNVNIEGGNLQLLGMQGDGIDIDDDFTMTEGFVEMNIEGEAAKGIKCGKLMTIEGGTISATASGALKNKKGDLAYCTIMKCDSNMSIIGGDFHLVNNSPGGKCISVVRNLEISGGSFYLETTGNGAEYTNIEGETDYYTSKCIAADTVQIQNGEMKCVSTGIGGKGIVGNTWVIIGHKNDSARNATIEIITKGECILNDTIRDQRFGCPKGIKAGERFYIYGGKVFVKTEGMGGEGIESKGSFFCYNGNIICETFDDGINVENKLHVFNGNIYCNSANNDAIDSNGRFTIEGGIVVGVSQHTWDESFDSDGYVNILGGMVLGIGNDEVNISEESTPLYNSNGIWDYNNEIKKTEWEVTEDMFVHICHNDNVLMSIKCPFTATNVFFTILHDKLEIGKYYSIVESNECVNPAQDYFDHKFYIGGVRPLTSRVLGTFTINNKNN